MRRKERQWRKKWSQPRPSNQLTLKMRGLIYSMTIWDCDHRTTPSSTEYLRNKLILTSSTIIKTWLNAFITDRMWPTKSYFGLADHSTKPCSMNNLTSKRSSGESTGKTSAKYSTSRRDIARRFSIPSFSASSALLKKVWRSISQHFYAPRSLLVTSEHRPQMATKKRKKFVKLRNLFLSLMQFYIIITNQYWTHSWTR